ncbi:Aste57867_24938 [Aphanomyces stellatus]|uniref:Aste57867_24938 protein n=1 Tax=Aphanomyces stellatus TaxID=120398 RepID=A0A485LSD9_9STRA|nr:hypothetical protein As57867_024860 [Aphanomyces stellatus]VFU01569.1 Aste57867_24938 [Aphanomyces stellatus]
MSASDDHNEWLHKFQEGLKQQNSAVIARGVAPPTELTENDECSICMEPMMHAADDADADDDCPDDFPDDHMQLRCGHRFHEMCLFEQDDRGVQPSNCPLCRATCLDNQGRFMAWRRHRHHGPMWFDVGDMLFDEERRHRDMSDSEHDAEYLLQLAGERNAVERITAMLARGVDPNAAYSDGTSALEMATLNSNVDVMRCLVEHGARVNDQVRYAARNDAVLAEVIGKIDEVCAGCNRANVPRLLKCGRCKVSRYCSRECQTGHWREHKAHCNWRAKQGTANP